MFATTIAVARLWLPGGRGSLCGSGPIAGTAIVTWALRYMFRRISLLCICPSNTAHHCLFMKRLKQKGKMFFLQEMHQIEINFKIVFIRFSHLRILLRFFLLFHFLFLFFTLSFLLLLLLIVRFERLQLHPPHLLSCQLLLVHLPVLHREHRVRRRLHPHASLRATLAQAHSVTSQLTGKRRHNHTRAGKTTVDVWSQGMTLNGHKCTGKSHPVNCAVS